jgi:transposase
LPKWAIENEEGEKRLSQRLGMMGQQQTQKDLFSYQVNLDRRIREDHPLRKLNSVLDWSFVRPAVSGCYGAKGNVSVDPVVIMKMMFLLFYENIVSERELMRIIPERLDYLWFLGYGIDEEIPNHSVLSKARARWGESIFEELFITTVQQAYRAGLVDGKKIHLDSSLIEADADPQKTVSGPPELIAALKTAYHVEEKKLEEKPRRAHYEQKNKSLMNTTDADAPMMARGKGSKHGQARARYKEQRVVDNSCGIITAVQTTGAQVEDGDLLEEMIDEHEQNTGTATQVVVTDSHYGTIQNYRRLQERGLRTHMAPRRPPGPARATDHFAAKEFKYQKQADTYLCPAGKYLHRRNYDRFRNAWIYKAQAGVCRTCPLRQQCTPSKTRRILMRYEGQEQIDRGLAQAQSGAGRRDRRRRQHLSEGSFAEAGRHHFRRARWRRLWRMRIQGYLIAAVQNLKKLCVYSMKSPTALVLRKNRPISLHYGHTLRPHVHKTPLSLTPHPVSPRTIITSRFFFSLTPSFN